MAEPATLFEAVDVDPRALARPRRYEHVEKRRTYALWAQHDLFGQLCLMRSWGAIDSRRGRLVSTPMPDVAGCVQRMEKEDGRRRARGYREVA